MIFIIKKSEILHSKYYKKTIKKLIPKNLPFFLTCCQNGTEQFYELKLLKLIALYITYIPVTFNRGSREEFFSFFRSNMKKSSQSIKSKKYFLTKTF
jgi:hypothetical protein